MASTRKTSFKLPPTTITDGLLSQEARRAKALEDQKRRRATRIDSSRNITNFAQLSLADDVDDEKDEDAVAAANPKRVPHGIAAFASLLEKDDDASSMASSSIDVPLTPTAPVPQPAAAPGTNRTKKQRKSRSKTKVNRWADKCMYAELLEMHEDWASDSPGDGIPDDLETGWIAVPVPRGKRCLAVTYQGLSRAPTSPSSLLNLHSRLLGKPIMAPFPCNLPPDTVLDCILDSNWKLKETSNGNGILHVLDVLRWNGRDVGSCEAGFRFWWRDTRFAEISPMLGYVSPPNYPTILSPVPYHMDLTFRSVLERIIPASRQTKSRQREDTMDMDVDPYPILPDGLLLYVKEATYESGTSPLSCWIPLSDGLLDMFERLIRKRVDGGVHDTEMSTEM